MSQPVNVSIKKTQAINVSVKKIQPVNISVKGSGLQGIQGEIGLTGPKGDTGNNSTVPGPTGPQGDVGVTGLQGNQGDTGATGTQGNVGTTGTQGDVGLTGPQGNAGLTGPIGPKGDDSTISGPIGLTGPKGDIGNTGIKGDIGLTGIQGDTGLTGTQGTTGDTGTTGIQGIKGDIGLTGPQGIQGETGSGTGDMLASNYDSIINDNTAKVSNIAHPLVETAVPIGALFTDTDTVYDDTTIQSEVDLNTDKIGITTQQATDIITNKTHSSSSHAPSGAQVNDSNTTLQGNTFGGANQLVKTNGDGNLISNKSIQFLSELDNGTKSANFNITVNDSQKQKVTLTSNTITCTLLNPTGAANFLLKVVNGGLATLTWASTTGSVFWSGKKLPTLTEAGTDLIGVYYDGTDFWLSASTDFGIGV